MPKRRPTSDEKECKRCNVKKKTTEFNAAGRRGRTHQSFCKECQRAYMTERYDKQMGYDKIAEPN